MELSMPERLKDLRLSDEMIDLLKSGRVDMPCCANWQTAYLLQAAHINEGDYFSSRVHKDIDAIMDDMRQTHRGGEATAYRKSL